MEKSSEKQVKEMDIFPLLFSFKGRIGRGQFSRWWLPLTLLSITSFYVIEEFAEILLLLMLWPLFALTTKRYHDFNSFGWLGLFQLLPIIGSLIVTAGCCFTIGDFKDNKYGQSIYQG